MTKQMQFPDYDELVRTNKNIYLDSIISRYGEENRELLSQRYDATKMCFFTNPDRLNQYIKYNSRPTLILETQKFFEEIGIINLDQDIQRAFFGEYKMFDISHYNLSFNNFGIFSFLESNNNKNPEEQRETFLSKFNPGDLLLYRGDSKALIIEKYSKIAEYAYSKLKKAMEKYSDVFDHIKYLTEEEDKLYEDRLRVYFGSIADLLCEEDRQLVVAWMNGGKKLDVNKLKDYPLFLNDVSKIKGKKYKKMMTFEPGLIEYFGPRISEEFMGATPERKTEINIRRIKYLELLGFDTKVIEAKYNLSSFDISKLSEVKRLLPKESVAVKLQENREFAQKKIAKTFFEKNIINSVELPYDWPYQEIMDAAYEIGHSWVNTKILPNGFDVYAFFGPHDNLYDVLDHDFDHEMTHSLETSCYYLDNGDFVRKIGIQIEIIKTNGLTVEKNKNTNEAVTEFLATESTRDRYRKKQYMFEEPKDAKIIENCSIYAKNLQKAKALIEILPPGFIKNRINPSVEFIYEYFDQDTWDEIDEMIDNDDVGTEEFVNYIESKRRKSL